MAHTDISKGIPIVVDESAYGKVKVKLKKYGSVRVGRIQTTLSGIPNDLRFRLVEGSPYLVPAAEGPFSLINIGKPEPLLGTAWTICVPKKDVSSTSQQKAESVWYKFWAGIEEPNKSVETACSKIKDFVDKKDSVPVYNFDEELTRFEGATLGPRDFIKQY